ncbi:MAG: LytR C-terminal domain-containing protein [Acidimicrobiales bacterium]|nr:LytR C-terminal domain-containing protein [Acidimicrobiales bacterium]
MSEESEQPRRRRHQQPAPPPQGSALKGAILVAVAVVIGLLLLRDDSSSQTQVTVGADDDPAEDDDDANTSSSSSSTTAVVREPAEVKVLVANGSSVNGAAGTQTTELEALGYVTANPTNAERVTATVVYFTEGYQPEAEALAEAIGASADAVQPLPTPAPVDDMQLSNVLVVLGPDLASAG